MNRAPDARASPTIAQEKVQTVLLIIVSFVIAWIGLTKFLGKRLETHASLPLLLRWSSSLSCG